MKRATFLFFTAFIAYTLFVTPHLLGAEHYSGRKSIVFSHSESLDVPNLREAIAASELFSKEHPGDRLGWERLARLHYRLAEATREKEYLEASLKHYLRASEVGRKSGRLLYSHELARIVVQIGDRGELDRIFTDLLSSSRKTDRGGYYLALVDYAEGLASFGDEAAAKFFEEAIEFYPEANVEAVNRYASWLLRKNEAEKALEVIDRLPASVRARHRVPSTLRNRIIDRLRLNIPKDFIQPMRRTSGREGGEEISKITALSYVHNSSSGDDCRAPGNPPRCFNSYGYCYPTYMVNLAEILWNEARSERIGAKDLVGWTVRNRAYQSLSCDAYPGGVTTSCRTSMLCSETGRCDLSARYCCVMHGGTLSPGLSQSQFNDAHVSIADLEMADLLYEAYLIVEGRVPDISTGFVPQGVSGCNLGCDTSYCSSGFNWTSPSPSGPMEYRGNNYCAVRQQCKRYVKNVCGQLGMPSSCSSPFNGGDNHFWNRIP